MTDSFLDKVDELLAQTPKESIRAYVDVNQVYAHYQHAHPEFKHPRGGQAFYLRDPLFGNQKTYFQQIARAVVKGQGRWAAVLVAEDLSHEVMLRAPWEYMDLRNSGHPTVYIDGETSYDRPPLVARLTEEQLKHKEQFGYLSRRRRGEV